MIKHRQPLIVIASACVLVTLTGCEKREVTSYSVKKEPAPAAPALPPQQQVLEKREEPPVGTTPSASTVRWPAPEGWTMLPEQKPMRLATFRAGEGATALEVVLSEFPGDAGGLLPNINRWRAQVSLPPATLDQIEADSTPVGAPPVAGRVFHLRGEPAHMLGAVLHDTRAGRTRFLKATGAPATIESHKPAFEQFARSLAAMKEGG